jgi:hypothetical protein
MSKTAKRESPTPTPAPATTSAPPAAPPRSDGFNDPSERGGASIIKGSKIRFTNNSEWLIGDNEAIPADQEFLVIECKKVLQKWGPDQKPETRVLEPGEFFPDMERLNDETPRDEWRVNDKTGKLEGPWQANMVLYLLDPKTMKAFTYPTHTVGGHIAVGDLKDEVQRARLLRGAANLYPIVTLGDTFMNTKHGGRQRPALNVVRYVPIGDAPARPTLDEPKPAPPMDDSMAPHA